MNKENQRVFLEALHSVTWNLLTGNDMIIMNEQELRSGFFCSYLSKTYDWPRACKYT